MERDTLYKELSNLTHKSNGNGFAKRANQNFRILENGNGKSLAFMEEDSSVTESEIKSGSKIQELVRGIHSRIVTIRKKHVKSKVKNEREFMPTSVPGVGYDFDILMDCMYDLEKAAIKEGYNFDKRLSAFRKIFYSSTGWNIIIPAAASTKLPASWTSTLSGKVKQVEALETIQIQGYDTAISHLFAGLDAINNNVKPLSLKFASIPIVKVSSNDVQATYTGDLGSVVYEYQKARGNVSFRNMAMKRDLPLLQKIYTQFVSDADMAGNADAYSLVLDKSLSIVQNLFDYYTAPAKTGVHLRYFNFAQMLMKPGSSKSVKTKLIDDIFAGSEAYAVGLKKDKGYLFLIMQDPGPGIFTPTFWEAAYNATQWVLEEFLDRLSNELAKI